jgi:N-acetylglucosamine-6-phosphate deacetylase
MWLLSGGRGVMAGPGTYWLCPDALFDGAAVVHGMAVGFADGTVCDVAAVADVPEGAVLHAVQGLVTPGFLDLQVNGGGDVLLNATPTADGMSAIAAAHRRFGTVGILPTVITDRSAVLADVARAAVAAKGRRGILGLHIEGPHIAVARRGTHAEHLVRPLDAATISIVNDLRRSGIAVLITLAPEAATPAQIGELAATGAVVSLGHTDATAEQTRAALAAGASCFTHLFNAMSPMLNRSPGVVGAAINSGAYAGIICDGFHVADEMVGLAIRARPVPDRMFLVSDAMPTVGGSDRFQLYGDEVRLVDGRLLNAEGSLAGAHVTMAQSVVRLVNVLGIDLVTALRMAVTVPARVIGRPDLAQIAGRDAADLLVLDAGLAVTGTCAGLMG